MDVRENSDTKSVDVALEVEEYIEILTTDDERLKIIGEELSNDTGRAILNKLFDGVNSISAIAHSLDVSVPLVSWHIQRLSRAGLIRIQHKGLSSKNKEVMHYTPVKMALIIVPSAIAKSSIYSKILKNALLKAYHSLAVAATFVGSTIAAYVIQRTITAERPVFTIENPDQTQVFSISSELAISLAIGVCISLAVWFVIRHTRKQIGTKNVHNI